MKKPQDNAGKWGWFIVIIAVWFFMTSTEIWSLIFQVGLAWAGSELVGLFIEGRLSGIKTVPIDGDIKRAIIFCTFVSISTVPYLAGTALVTIGVILWCNKGKRW